MFGPLLPTVKNRNKNNPQKNKRHVLRTIVPLRPALRHEVVYQCQWGLQKHLLTNHGRHNALYSLQIDRKHTLPGEPLNVEFTWVSSGTHSAGNDEVVQQLASPNKPFQRVRERKRRWAKKERAKSKPQSEINPRLNVCWCRVEKKEKKQK